MRSVHSPKSLSLLLSPDSALYLVVQSLQDDAGNPQSLLNRHGQGQKDVVLDVIGTVKEEIGDLQHALTKYKSLGAQKARIFDRFMFGPEDFEKKRVVIARQVSYLSQFRDSLQNETLARIERALELGMLEFKVGNKAPSIVSLHESGSDDAWPALIKELEDEGFSKTEIVKHKSEIRKFIKVLVEGDTLGLPSQGDYENGDGHSAVTCFDELQLGAGYVDDTVLPDDSASISDPEEAMVSDSTSSGGSSPGPYLHSQSGTAVPVQVAIAIRDFEAALSTGVSFKKGDLMEIVDRTPNRNDWWTFRLDTLVGDAPCQCHRDFRA